MPNISGQQFKMQARYKKVMLQTDSNRSLIFSESHLNFVHFIICCICIYTNKICFNQKVWMNTLMDKGRCTNAKWSLTHPKLSSGELNTEMHTKAT